MSSADPGWGKEEKKTNISNTFAAYHMGLYTVINEKLTGVLLCNKIRVKNM